ncbi:MAG: hypothetical protein ACK5TQ_07330, partial [Acetobacteraceae bacterium]
GYRQLCEVTAPDRKSHLAAQESHWLKRYGKGLTLCDGRKLWGFSSICMMLANKGFRGKFLGAKAVGRCARR